MLRNLVILFNLFFVVLLRLLFGPAVEITQQFPENVKPGEEFTVTLTVSKGDVSGFAKLQQELPEGFTAVAGELQGASFTFSDGKAKFIWMSLPKDPSFSITYKVTAGPAASGSYPIGGTFSYLEGSDKQVVDITEKNIVVIPETMAAAGGTTTDNNEQPDSGAGNTEEGNETGSTGGMPDNRTAPAEVSCSRQIDLSRLAGENIIGVTVKVSKPGVTGFAKIQETLPAGFSAVSVETSQSNFSFSDQQAKFVWMALPSSDEITVRYNIIAKPGTTGEFFINGDFSYLVENETSKCTLPRDRFLIEAPALAENADSGNLGQEQQQQETAQNTGKTTETTNTGKKNTTGNTGKTGNVPAPQGGIVYKVQIAATHKQVQASYFTRKYGIAGNIETEMHEGWNKFLIGGFAQYREARDKRNETRANNQGLIGPFVTAYNNGQRITVQEALMISAQKWVK